MNGSVTRFLAVAMGMLVGGHVLALTCSMSATSLAFGPYNPLSPSAILATNTLRVTCDGAIGELVHYSIALGAGGSASYTLREMTGRTGVLQYNLYQDFARTLIWGDGQAGTALLQDGYVLSSTSASRSYLVYGRVIPGQNVRVGNYSDTISVTLNF